MSLLLVVRCVLIGLALCAAAPSASAVGQSLWTPERISRLFPPPPRSVSTKWLDAGPVTVRSPDAPPVESDTAGAIAGVDAPPSVRLVAHRTYTMLDGTIDVSIDSEDLERAGMVLALNGYMVGPGGALVPANDEVLSIGTQLGERGLEPLAAVPDHLGFVAASAANRGSVLTVLSGLSGTVTMTCSRVGCVDDLLALLAEVPWADVDAFVAYAHRHP